MKTIRRVYFYLVAAISVETLLWGVINLLRFLFTGNSLSGNSQSLSVGLAQIIISIPFFLFHWLIVQKDAARSEEDQTSHVRAVFLFAMLLGTLIPVVQNVLALINRLVLSTARVSSMTALVGNSQTTSDNLIAIVLNLILAAYFYRVLQSDRKLSPLQVNLQDVKRVYRYIWMGYSLGMVILGVNGLIQWLFRETHTIDSYAVSSLINPIMLLVVGVPIWVYVWNNIQQSVYADGQERTSLWRVVLFYLLNLGFAATVYGTGIAIASRCIKSLQSLPAADTSLLSDLSPLLAAFVPFLVLWLFYLRHFYADIESRSDLLTRQSMYRLYRTILAFMGLAGSVGFLLGLLNYTVDLILTRASFFDSSFETLSLTTAGLAISLFFWLYFYLPENRLAAADDEYGDHARRSIIRKIYLYAAIFCGVVGIMVTGGMTIYQVLEMFIPVNASADFTDIVKGILQVALFAVFMGYHLSLLRKDGKAALVTLQTRQAACKVWMALPEASPLTVETLRICSRQAPGIHIELVQAIPAEGVPADVQAVVLLGLELTSTSSAWLAALEGYAGRLIVLPEKPDKWVWLNPLQKEGEIAHTLVLTLRALAEGRPVQIQRQGSAWMILGYIVGGFILLNLLSLILGLFFNM